MNTRRMLVLVTMLALALFAFAAAASADGGATTESSGTEAVNGTVDLTNYGVNWGGSGYNTWYVTTKNVGSGAAGGFWIRVTKTNGTVLKWVWVPSLAAGAKTTFSVTTTDKCIYVMVDYTHVVAESNELNNFIAPCSPFK